METVGVLFLDQNVFSDYYCVVSDICWWTHEPGEHEEQEEGGDPCDDGHVDVLHILAAHPTNPPSQGSRNVQGYNRQHFYSGDLHNIIHIIQLVIFPYEPGSRFE